MNRRASIWAWFVGLVLVVGVLSVLTVRNAGRAPDEVTGERPEARKAVMQQALSASLPERLAGLERRQMLVGAAALEEIARLHGKALELSGGRVARYGDPPGITVWVGQEYSAAAADKMVRTMVDAITTGRTPFRLLSGSDGGIARAIGLGQAHAFYASGAQVVWVEAPEGAVEPVLDEIADVLPW